MWRQSRDSRARPNPVPSSGALLYNGYRGSFPGGKVRPGRDTGHSPHLMPRPWMSRGYISVPAPPGCVVGLLYLLQWGGAICVEVRLHLSVFQTTYKRIRCVREVICTGHKPRTGSKTCPTPFYHHKTHTWTALGARDLLPDFVPSIKVYVTLPGDCDAQARRS